MILFKDMMKTKLLLIFMTALVFIGCTDDKIPITTSNSEARQNFLTGRDYLEKIQVEDAIEYFEKAVELDPDFATAYLYLSLIQEGAEERYTLLEKAKSLVDHVSDGERLYILAISAGISGHSKKQEEYLKKRIELYPNDERALNDLAGYYYQQHEYPKAIVYLKRATDINPQFSTPYNQLGYAYRYLGKYAEAENAFKKYIKLMPEDPNPYDSYAELLLKMGEFDVSVETYEKALEIDPDFTPSHYGIASNLIYMRQYDKARSRLKHMYKIARTEEVRVKAIYGTAITYIAENDIEKSLNELNTLFERATEKKDTTSMIQNRLLITWILLDNNRPDDAEQLLSIAGDLLENSNIPDAIKNNLRRPYLSRLSLLALKRNNLSLAKDYAEKYLNYVKKSENRIYKSYYNTLSGLIAFTEKNYSEAVDEFEKSNLDDPYNNFQLGMAYLKNGEESKAEAKFKNVIEYNELVTVGYVILRNKAEKILAKLSVS